MSDENSTLREVAGYVFVMAIFYAAVSGLALAIQIAIPWRRALL